MKVGERKVGYINDSITVMEHFLKHPELLNAPLTNIKSGYRHTVYTVGGGVLKPESHPNTERSHD